MNRHLFGVIWFVAAFMASMSVQAKAESPEPSALERINQKVEEQTDKLQKLDTLQAELEQQRAELKQNLQKLQGQEQALNTELTKLTDQQKDIDREISKTDAEIKRLRDLSAIRLRTLYMNSGSGVVESLIVGGSNSISRDAYYLTRVEKFDRTIIDSYRDTLKQREQRRLELGKVLTQKAGVKEKLSGQRAAINQQVSAQEKLLATIKKQRDLREGLITSLRSQALRLETVVSTIMGATESTEKSSKADNALKIEPKEKHELVQEAKSLIPTTEPSSTGFEGQGLPTSLIKPVEGGLLATKSKDSGFDSLVAKKGLEFSSEPGADVHAVAKGRVIFVGRMPAYGTIMILDHGQRFYTLYGRLSATIASVGAVVDQGAVIAKAGRETGSAGLYFEVRKNGQTVNPKPFFKGKL